MTSTTNPAGSITEATALLQAELPQLEEYQRTLEKELASVTERLESVRGALTALQALSATPIPAPREAESGNATVTGSSSAVAEEAVSEPLPSVEAEEAVATPAPEDWSGQKAEPAARTRAAGTRRAKTAPAGKRTQAKKTGKQTPDGKQAPVRDKKAPAGKQAPVRDKKAPAKSQDAAASPALADASGLTDQVVAVLTRNADTPLRARDVAQALGRDDSTGSVNTVRSTLDRLVATSRAHRAGRGLYQAPRS
ncbi:hypothetical protein AB0903_13285 [Streptomyces sp. NPDC048389]|uniref:hypothetical protein n=1 Tax=Streptomyces sp. NPDC048389 TaxID=3154622 RepID=UPI0034545A22